MSFIANLSALTAANPVHLAGGVTNPGAGMTTLNRDPTWLQVEVCREFLRQSCKRDNTECKYAHPSSNVDIQNGKVTVCFDAFKDRCTRSNCKYFHAPAQMKADLEMRGKMSLMRQKSEQLALQQNNSVAAAQLALLQLQNPLLNPFLQNVAQQPNLFQSSALAQYQQLLQQSYGNALSSAAAVQQTTPPGTVTPPSSNNLGHLDPNNQIALATPINGTAPLPNHVSPGVCSSPPNKAFTTVEVCREFSRGTCTRSEDDCRFAHPEPQVSVDGNENRVTVCMDYAKTGVCARSTPSANNTGSQQNNNNNTADKCKYYHPPNHILEKVKNGSLGQQHQSNGLIYQPSSQSMNHFNNNVAVTGTSPIFTFQSPLSIQQLNQHQNFSAALQNQPQFTCGVPQGLLPSSTMHLANQMSAQVCNNDSASALLGYPAKRKVLEGPLMQSAAVQVNNPLLQNNNNMIPSAKLPSNSSAALANCAATNANMFPTYGKMLRLDSNGLNGAKMGAAVNLNMNGAALGASPIGAFNAYTPYGTSPGSPQGTFFYSPVYQAQLSAALSASSQPSLLPATSPAYLTNHGATIMNGAHSPAMYASSVPNGRFAAFG